jgi:hypothetical protein
MAATTAPLPDIQSTEAAEAGVRAFLQLAALWNLTREEMVILLGMRSTSTLDNWRKKPPETLSRDTMERISYCCTSIVHCGRSFQRTARTDGCGDRIPHLPSWAGAGWISCSRGASRTCSTFTGI